MSTAALCVPKAEAGGCFPVTQLLNCTNSIQVPNSFPFFLFFLFFKNAYISGPSLQCIHFLQPHCHPKLLPTFQQHQFLWASVSRKGSVKLVMQPEPSNLRPPPLHTPMEIKGWVGDSWPTVRADGRVRIQPKGNVYSAFQGHLAGERRDWNIQVQMRLKTTLKGRN